MRIAIVGYFNPKCISDFLSDENIPDVNKAATAVNTLVVAFLKAGHYVKVFTSFPEKCDNMIFKGENVEVHLVSSYSKAKLTGLFSQVYMVKRPINLMEGRIDDVDVIHAHWTYAFAFAAKHFAGKKKIVCTVRDWCPYILSIQTGLKNKISWIIRYIIFRKVMKGDSIKFIANSQYTYDRILSEYPRKKVQIIPNPIDQSLIISKKINPEIKHRFISIAQSIDDKRKNILTLLKAFALYTRDFPDAVLILVGHYSINGEVYKEIQHYSNSITLTGVLAREEIINLLDESSCLVHSSLEETFGNILLEAMAREVPCIGGEKSGAVPLVLDNGKCGVLCDITDYKAIYEAMIKVNDSDYRKYIVDNASKMLKESYSSDIIANKHIMYYKSLLSNGES